MTSPYIGQPCSVSRFRDRRIAPRRLGPFRTNRIHDLRNQFFNGVGAFFDDLDDVTVELLAFGIGTGLWP